MAVDPTVQRRQLLARRTAEFLPTGVDASLLDGPAEEVKAAILLFYSLLDQQQRRLYAGLESLKLGRGGTANWPTSSTSIHLPWPVADYSY